MDLGTIRASVKLDFSSLVADAAAVKAFVAEMATSVTASVTQMSAAVKAKLASDTAASVEASAAAVEKRVGRMASQVGTRMLEVGAGIAVGLGVAANAAGKFDGALRDVDAVAHLSAGQFRQLHDGILKLTDDPHVRQGPVDLAKGMYRIMSAGFGVKDGLEIARQGAIGASAGLTTAATSTLALIKVMTAYKGTNLSAKDAMDLMIQEVNTGINRFPELAAGIGTVAPFAHRAGLSLQEVLAALATMSKTMSMPQAIVALNNLLNKVIKPSKDAGKALHDYGITQGETAFTAAGLAGWLQQVTDKTHGNLGALGRIMPELRAKKGLIALLTDGTRDYTKHLEGMAHATDGAGAAVEGANRQNKGATAQIEKMTQQIQTMEIEIGEKVLPVERNLISTVKDVASAFTHLSSETQGNIVKFVALVGGMTLVSGAGLKLIGMAVALKSALASVGLSVTGLGADLVVFATGPVGLAIGALAALGLAIRAVMSDYADFQRQHLQRGTPEGEAAAAALPVTVQSAQARMAAIEARRKQLSSNNLFYSRIYGPQSEQARNARAAYHALQPMTDEARGQLASAEEKDRATQAAAKADAAAKAAAAKLAALLAAQARAAAKAAGDGYHDPDKGKKRKKELDDLAKQVDDLKEKAKQAGDRLFALTHNDFEVRQRDAVQQFEEDRANPQIGQRRALEIFSATWIKIAHEMSAATEEKNRKIAESDEASAKAAIKWFNAVKDANIEAARQEIEVQRNGLDFAEKWFAALERINSKLIESRQAARAWFEAVAAANEAKWQKEHPSSEHEADAWSEDNPKGGNWNSTVPAKAPDKTWQGVVAGWKQTVETLKQGAENILGNAIEQGFTGHWKKAFQGILQAFTQMLAQMLAKMLASGIINLLTGGAGGFIGGFFKGFDDGGNDRNVHRWGWDFASMFEGGMKDYAHIQGAAKGPRGAGAAGADGSRGVSVVVNMTGDHHYHTDMDARRMSETLAWHTSQRLAVVGRA